MSNIRWVVHEPNGVTTGSEQRNMKFQTYVFEKCGVFSKLEYSSITLADVYLSLEVFGCLFEVSKFVIEVFVTLLNEEQNVVFHFSSKYLLGALNKYVKLNWKFMLIKISEIFQGDWNATTYISEFNTSCVNSTTIGNRLLCTNLETASAVTDPSKLLRPSSNCNNKQEMIIICRL